MPGGEEWGPAVLETGSGGGGGGGGAPSLIWLRLVF